jgi:hypothetical protein
MKAIFRNTQVVFKTKIAGNITKGRLEGCYVDSSRVFKQTNKYYCDWYFNDGLTPIEIKVEGTTTVYGSSAYVAKTSVEPAYGVVATYSKVSAATAQAISETYTIQPNEYFCVLTFGFAETIPTVTLL